LNPGPHGPEPCRRRVLECPGGFFGGRLNSSGVAFVSFCDLSEPSASGMRDPAVIRRRVQISINEVPKDGI